MSRSLRYERMALRDLECLSERDREAVVAALNGFAAGAMRNADVKKLVDVSPPRYRLRVGRYRAILAFERDRIVVERVLDRRDAYR
jgi:mRNA-degrading endonuclease RelE of RelBE toxin-antitoxin system